VKDTLHHRRSIRLPGYDYSRDGAYFVTICTQDRDCLFGAVDNGQTVLNKYGKIAEQCWVEIPQHFPHVELDEYIIMPNHAHGIIMINDDDDGCNVGVQNCVGVQNFEPLRNHQRNQFQKIIPRSIGSIIRGYKIGVTKWFRQNTQIKTVWQRNYHERIIRSSKELNRIREYIENNPANWKTDQLYRLTEKEIAVVESK